MIGLGLAAAAGGYYLWLQSQEDQDQETKYPIDTPDNVVTAANSQTELEYDYRSEGEPMDRPAPYLNDDIDYSGHADSYQNFDEDDIWSPRVKV